MTSRHPFYPILIPNTPHVKFVVQWFPKNHFNDIQTLFELGFVISLFQLKQKIKFFFVRDVLKLPCEGVKLRFFMGALQQKVGKSQEFSGMGCLKTF